MEQLVEKILNGDKKALDTLVNNIQQNIYNLSLRFLWSKEDAEDATQEILVKVITNLAQFNAKSKFTTWVYRISVNHLLNIKKNLTEQHINFSSFSEDLAIGLHSSSYDLPDKNILTQEVKIGCTTGMLICLPRNIRIAYILGEIFELNSNDAAEAQNITAVNHRKRLSQARTTLQKYMTSHCGLVNKKNLCRCSNRIQYAIDTGKFSRHALNFVSDDTITRSTSEMEDLYTVAAIFKSHPVYSINQDKVQDILNVLSNMKNILS